MFSSTTAQHIYRTNTVQLYSLQLNCTYSNYTEAAATCSAAQHIYCTNTVQLYSLQLNCTYSNYTEAAATCSAAQQHNTFTVQILYNCTVCNWTVLTVITQKLLLHVQLQNSTQALNLMSSEAQCSQVFDAVCVYKESRLETIAILDIRTSHYHSDT